MMNPTYISNLLSDKDLEKESVRRIKDTITTEYPIDVVNFESLCEKYGSENVKLIKSRKVYKCTSQKNIGDKFEDRVWSILYRMGFTEINGQNCKLYRDETGTITKQIDIIAHFESIVLVIECKSTSKLKRTIKPEIDEFASVKQTSDQFVKKYFNNGSNKIEVAWILATDSEILEKGTYEQARNNNIRLISNWDYYDKLSTILGKAAKYQLLANLFQQRSIQGLTSQVFAIKGTVGKYTFYQFSIKPNELMRIAFVPHQASDSNNLALYQRLVKPGRLKHISEYITNENGVFPTNIVINLSNKDKKLRFDKIKNNNEGLQIGLLSLPNYFGSAEIIDGQHRLFSYAGLSESETSLLPVFAFENIDIDDQAKLFVKINGEQDKVKTELLNSVVGYQNWNSGDEVKQFYALPLVLTSKLNENDKSPLFHKIKMDNGKDAKRATVTYTEFSEKLKEIHLFGTLKNKKIHPDLLYTNNPEESLKNGFKFISLFFEYLLNGSFRFKEHWDNQGFLSNNSTVIPLLGIIKNILSEISKKTPIYGTKINSYIDEVYKYEDIICSYFDNLDGDELSHFKLGAGKKGYQMRTEILMIKINENYPKFMRDEVLEIKSKQISNKESGNSAESIRELESKMQFTVKHILSDKYGQYWFTTNIPPDVRNAAVGRAVDHGEYNDYIRGCMLIDMKKIAEYKQNNIDLQILNIFNEQKKSNYFGWIAKLNEIRNNLFHSGWSITDDDEKYLKEIVNRFDDRFEEFIESKNLINDWEKHCLYTPPDINSK